MTKELDHGNGAINPIGEVNIALEGNIPQQSAEAIRFAAQRQAQSVHKHYMDIGNPLPIAVTKTDFPIIIRSNEVYRNSGNGANTWRYNYVLGPTSEGGIIINAAVVEEMPEEYHILLDHEIRHGYLARAMGNDVFGCSFSLREGTAGLCVNSTSRLQDVLMQGNDKITLPLLINHWDKQLDEKETNLRCYINNPWYLGMFSFYHDYIGEELQMFPRLIQTYKEIAKTGKSLSEAWNRINPDVKSLEHLQQGWIEKNTLSKYV